MQLNCPQPSYETFTILSSTSMTTNYIKRLEMGDVLYNNVGNLIHGTGHWPANTIASTSRGPYMKNHVNRPLLVKSKIHISKLLNEISNLQDEWRVSCRRATCIFLSDNNLAKCVFFFSSPQTFACKMLKSNSFLFLKSVLKTLQ